jgi:hypothetical protein
MIKEFMFTTSTDYEVCDHYSLMDQIKNLQGESHENHDNTSSTVTG